jgi:hypothetical protein
LHGRPSLTILGSRLLMTACARAEVGRATAFAVRGGHLGWHPTPLPRGARAGAWLRGQRVPELNPKVLARTRAHAKVGRHEAPHPRGRVRRVGGLLGGPTSALNRRTRERGRQSSGRASRASTRAPRG